MIRLNSLKIKSLSNTQITELIQFQNRNLYQDAMNLEKEKINSDSTLPENIITAENIVKKFNSDKSISDETIDMFVKKIFISSNEEIEIEFNFKDIFDTQI